MESLEVVQKGLSLCPTYQVSGEGNDIILTVQKYLFTSKWTMVKGKQGAELHAFDRREAVQTDLPPVGVNNSGRQ